MTEESGHDIGVQTREVAAGVKIENRLRLKTLHWLKGKTGKGFKELFTALLESAERHEPDFDLLTDLVIGLHWQTDPKMAIEQAEEHVGNLTVDELMLALDVIPDLFLSEAENPPSPDSQTTTPSDQPTGG